MRGLDVGGRGRGGRAGDGDYGAWLPSFAVVAGRTVGDYDGGCGEVRFGVRPAFAQRQNLILYTFFSI